MIRVWIVMAIVWVAIVAALFTLADVISRAVGRPDDIHLCAIAIIVAVMLFSVWVVSAVDRGRNPFK
jgi:hypothetical protein